ncbi:MAG: penicillin-binding protein 2 [Sutterellaceae bacterium]|nr:penicillin-binding protein 2 [Burkholderiaceae bacterium]MCX7900993.1 penicillin-binding protein 2 [Burkholderiaceae bacterium]MDW8430154.1 penicillin-binding protein 2 [Sutterellaceae bacterium]
MKPLRDPQRELLLFRTRIVVASGAVAFACLLLLSRFIWLQVLKHDDYHARAESNRIAIVPVPANRGLIKDRHGRVIARNYSAYTLEINPREVRDVNAVIDALAQVVEIQPRDRRRFRKLLEELRGADSIPIRTRLSDEEVARFAANKFRFPGVELRARLFRHYPLGEVGSHLIGYIGRISPADKERIATWPDAANYVGTDYIGKVGLEQSYERELHGTTGFEEVEITAGGRPVRTLSRTPPVPGNNLILSVDMNLQEVAERAFGNRRGALIAIEPATGDVLAFVSKPTFDPNLFVEGIDPVNWEQLNNDPDKPLLNRALRGTYPIGSTYKPFLALAALELGKRRPEQVFHDPGYFIYGGHRFRDSNKVPLGPVDLHRSIVKSSDVYYYMLANDLGVDAIHDFMKPFGFGQLTGIDIEGEQTGILPSTAWKERRFKQKWYGGETISIGIGQGYNSFTLLQLAHATAILANNGIVMKPHLVKAIEDPRTGQRRLTVPKESYRIPLKPENLRVVREAMVDVNISGTARVAFQGVPYRVAGKTGTAQVIGIKQNEKYDERRIHERHRDHSLYIAFAPADAPTIALAVIVENGGFGAVAAAPIARQVLDYYLLGKVPTAPALPREGAEPLLAQTGIE